VKKEVGSFHKLFTHNCIQRRGGGQTILNQIPAKGFIGIMGFIRSANWTLGGSELFK